MTIFLLFHFKTKIVNGAWVYYPCPPPQVALKASRGVAASHFLLITMKKDLSSNGFYFMFTSNINCHYLLNEHE